MKVERIYVIFNDDCHEYLIDYEYYNAFENEYDNICDLLRSNDIDGDNDVVLKFKFKDVLGRWVSVSAKTLKEAQQVVDDIYGTSKDGKHKYVVSACRV